ncbi:hypothetical protein QUF75_16455 [Desulfococcaceae bacterium HSG7]|nr:hypothetical protein [Desulfococcaceae bacterium HSG7]
MNMPLRGHTVLGISRTAPVDANPGVTHLNGKVQSINVSGSYHAFDEDATL